MGGIIWLASFPKSGNTWMRSFLHNLLRNPTESYDINTLTDFTLGEAQTRWFKPFDPRPGSQYSLADVRRMRPLVHRHLTTFSPDSVFVKTHNALIEDEGVPLVTMGVTAGAIYIVRDPRDVVISYSHHQGQSLDFAIDMLGQDFACTGGDDVNVYEYLSSWSRHVRSWTHTPNPTLLTLRYEDLLDQPLKSFGSVAKFLGLEVARPRLDKAMKLSSFKVLKAQEQRKGFIERPAQADGAFFREGKAGQWKKILTPEQVARIEADHGEQMRRFGYL
jgi:hypothetical protein